MRCARGGNGSIGLSYMTSMLVVLGAQKAGTSTLMADMHCCSKLNFDQGYKEESLLLDVTGSSALRRLRRRLNQKKGDVVPVDVSTRYTMSPIESIPFSVIRTELAGAKFVYLMRDPVDRTKSHYRHDTLLGLASGCVDSEITLSSCYVANSLYGSQLVPWIRAFGSDNIYLVRFEDYIKSRKRTVKEICNFVGVSDEGVDRIDECKVENVTSSRSAYPRWISKLSSSLVYRRYFRRYIPSAIIRRGKEQFSLENTTSPVTIPVDVEEYLMQLYRMDIDLLKRVHPKVPCWHWM